MSKEIYKEEREPLISPQNDNQSEKRVSIVEPSSPKEERKPLVPREAPSFTAGIAITLSITFLSSVCFSIVLPSICFYIENKLHQPQSYVGWAVAVNSIGSFLASPLFGYWVDRRSTREVLLCTLIIMVIGNIMYSLATNLWMLLAGRFIVGVAAANYAVAQTYLSYATTEQNRTKVMALNSAATVLGFIIGPAFALLTTLFKPFSIKEITVDADTLPGYLSAILSIISMFTLAFLKEIPSSYKRNKVPLSGGSKTYGSGFYAGGGSIKDLPNIIKLSKNQKIPWIPVLICLYAYFTYTASFTTFETIGTPYTAAAFGWGTRTNSLMYIALGGVCVGSLVILQFMVRYFSDRVLLILTTALATAGFISMFTPSETQFVSLWRFWVGVSLCSASYSTSVAVLISVYSKILENLDQGMMMGWLSSAGSVARIVGPIIASYSLEYGGQSGFLVFIIMIGITGSTILVLIAGYRTLVSRVSRSLEINA